MKLNKAKKQQEAQVAYVTKQTQALEDLEVKNALLTADLETAKATQAELEVKAASLRFPVLTEGDSYAGPSGLQPYMAADKGAGGGGACTVR
eukprot:9092728-Pyramimonas_sp.AAC.1